MFMLTGGVLLASLFISANVKAQNLGDMVLANGLKYIGTPYVPHVLDQQDKEELVLNTDELDCLTFIEYVLAETLCPKLQNGDISESAFADKVQLLRYRDGKIDGYASRLHYGTDWIMNAVRLHLLQDITEQRGNAVQVVDVFYMTTHPDQYRSLGNAKTFALMKQVEKSLTGQKFSFLPKDELSYNGAAWIKNGDIIAITTDKPGLDIAHFGIAFYVEGKLTLLHASSDEGKVVVSQKALPQMLKEHVDWTGIRVLRIVQ